MDKNEVKKVFPVFNEIELLEEMSEFGIEMQFKKGDPIIRKGQYIKYMPLILEGSLSVMRDNEDGDEVLLYFLEGGDTCSMSMTCCMRSEKSNIWANAESDTRLLMIPTQYTDDWMKKYSSWRNFVLSSYALRMEELLQTVDSIAFKSLDERLMKYLKDRSKALGKSQFEITHSEIARSLNSSREAVSRLLKKLENLGEVKLGRNRVELVD